MPPVRRQSVPTTAASAVPPCKVLLFYQDFGEMGGIERYLIQTACWLRERGNFEPMVVCCAGTPLFHRLKAENIAVYGLPWHPWFGKSFLRSLDIGTFSRLAGILRAEKPAIVHVHIGLLENLLLKAWGYPVVWTFHGYSSLYSLDSRMSALKQAFKRLTRRCFRMIARRMDALLFVSEAERQRMRTEGYLPEDVSADVLWNGLDCAAWQDAVTAARASGTGIALRKQLGIPESSQCISFINRMDANKNPEAVLALARQLQADESGAEYYFLLAGEGPLSGTIREACARSDRFRYLGHWNNVAELLAITDLLIYPARREGFGLGLLEAMAAGVPCLAYASGGASEILDTPATRECLVPVDELGLLAQKTIAFFRRTSTARAELSTALRERAAAFSHHRFIEGLEVVYRRLSPLVSVILPVHNGEATVMRAVESVLGQTASFLELIIVDDGSTDRTSEWLAGIRNSRVTVLSQENSGVAAARNLAFRHAKGDYIAFIDADDRWLPRKLAVELQTVRRHTWPDQPACMVYSSYYAVDDRDRLIHLPPIPRVGGALFRHALEREGLFLPSTTLVHRRALERTGGFKTDCYHEDRAFFIEACRYLPAYPTGERLVIYRQSLSGRCRRVLQDYAAALSAELSIVETLRPVLSEGEAAELTRLQKRNLLQRFLMYGYLSHARQLARTLREECDSGDTLPASLFSGLKGKGLKGWLVRLSLASGINVLLAARLFCQAGLRLFSWQLPSTGRSSSGQTFLCRRCPSER